jgi:hypothetical protein
MLVGGVLTAAVLCTLVVKGGWLIWVPVLLALYTLAVVWNALSRS